MSRKRPRSLGSRTPSRRVSTLRLDFTSVFSDLPVPLPALSREHHFFCIFSFIENRLKCKRGDSLFVCGSPGTGKSLTIKNAMKALETASFAALISTHYTNANAFLARPKSLLDWLLAEISPTGSLDPFLTGVPSASEHAIYRVVFVDEMDLFAQSGQGVLASLISWSQAETSRLILIGIQNTVALDEAFRRQFFKTDPPCQLIFERYTRAELRAIMDQLLRDNCIFPDDVKETKRPNRLLGADDSKSGSSFSKCPFSPLALDFCAAKVASTSGDVRNCVEICRMALEAAQSAKDKEWMTHSRVSYEVMRKLVMDRLGSPLTKAAAVLPSHPLILLCVASVFFVGEVKEATTERLYDMYQTCAEKLVLPKIAEGTRFKEFLTLLAAQGLLKSSSPFRKRQPRGAAAGSASKISNWSITISRTELEDSIDTLAHEHCQRVLRQGDALVALVRRRSL